MTLDECRQNNGKVETKFAIANRPSDVVSRIHVYVDLDGYVYKILRRSGKNSPSQIGRRVS